MNAEQTPPVYTPPEPLSPSDERMWAMVSHLSILVNLASGFLGPVVLTAFLIWGTPFLMGEKKS